MAENIVFVLLSHRKCMKIIHIFFLYHEKSFLLVFRGIFSLLKGILPIKSDFTPTFFLILIFSCITILFLLWKMWHFRFMMKKERIWREIIILPGKSVFLEGFCQRKVFSPISLIDSSLFYHLFWELVSSRFQNRPKHYIQALWLIFILIFY